MQYSLMRRDTPWVPKFKWVDTIDEVADWINRPHEDYPTRIEVTASRIRSMLKVYQSIPMPVNEYQILGIHRRIFNDESFAGEYRKVNVRVGYHIAPDWRTVPKLMEELIWNSQYIVHLGELYKFYHDFETIHPFQDGNGRTGGVMVAVMSHLIDPKNGYLAPCQ